MYRTVVASLEFIVRSFKRVPSVRLALVIFNIAWEAGHMDNVNKPLCCAWQQSSVFECLTVYLACMRVYT